MAGGRRRDARAFKHPQAALSRSRACAQTPTTALPAPGSMRLVAKSLNAVHERHTETRRTRGIHLALSTVRSTEREAPMSSPTDPATCMAHLRDSNAGTVWVPGEESRPACLGQTCLTGVGNAVGLAPTAERGSSALAPCVHGRDPSKGMPAASTAADRKDRRTGFTDGSAGSMEVVKQAAMPAADPPARRRGRQAGCGSGHAVTSLNGPPCDALGYASPRTEGTHTCRSIPPNSPSISHSKCDRRGSSV